MFYQNIVNFATFTGITANATSTARKISWIAITPDPSASFMVHASSSQTGTGSIKYYLEFSADGTTWQSLPSEVDTDSTDTAKIWFNEFPCAKFIRVRAVVTGTVTASASFSLVTSAAVTVASV